MSIPLAKRSESLEPFLAMEVMERAFELERGGTPVAHLEIGEPDFPPPPAAVEACVRALRSGETRYTDSRGLIELRQAIVADLDRRRGVSVDPGRVIVTSGTSPAMLLVFSLLVDPGDEVVIGAPHYPCYPNFVRYCGGVPVAVRTDAESNYALDPDAVRRAITPRTRAIIVASPANPTGAIQSAETMRALAQLGPPLVSDEIYDGLVYDGAVTTSALEVSEQSFVLDGFSKRYAMTGFRLGYVISPPWAMRRMQIMQQNFFISASRFTQHAGIAALESGAESVARIRDVYAQRRVRLVNGLRKLGFAIPQLPQGAFYVLADASGFGALGRDSQRFAFQLLEKAHVGVTPGIDFGSEAEGKLRFCYAVSEQTIDRALASIGRVLPELHAAAQDASDGAPTRAGS